MTWLPKAKEALDQAERLASLRALSFERLAERVRKKKSELEDLERQLDQSVKDSLAEEELVQGATVASEEQAGVAALLAEIKRLTEALEKSTAEAQDRDRVARDRWQECQRLQKDNERLEEDLRRGREALDRVTAVRETRATTAEERTRVVENILRDIHHALLHQPDQTREHIASMIAKVVEPYTPGEKPQ